MPGIAGFLTLPGDQQPTSQLTLQLVSDLRLDAEWRPRSWSNDSAGVTLVTVGRDDASAEQLIATVNGDTLAMEGELFGGFTTALGGMSPAEYLLRGYQEAGDSFLAGVEGRFVAACWSSSKQELALFADKIASKPLYYKSRHDGFAFSTSVRSLATLPGDLCEQSQTGLIQFFTFGHLWNNETLFSNVSCLGPGTKLGATPSGKLSSQTYWRPQKSPQAVSEADSLDRISSTLKQAVAEQAPADAEGLGVALSGGLDARTILALVDTAHVRPKCVSLGMEGSLDQRSAKRLADLAGCEYRQLVLGEGFLEGFESHLHRMIGLTDGHYLSQCIVLPTLPLYGELGVRKLLRGHAGELLHMHKAYNFSVDSEFHSIRDAMSLEAWLWSRLQSHLTAGVNEPLLAGVTQDEFAAVGRESLRESLVSTEHFDDPLDRISQLFLDQRTRRETAMSLVKFNSVVDIRVPYFDSRFLEAAFNTPANLRTGERAHAEVLRRYRPDFMQPANSNTGAPVGSSEFWKQFCYNRMRVLAKLGVKGYQPYERLGLWLRRELRPMVESILLSPQCLDRGLFNPDCVRAVVKRNNAGQQNHTYLIMAMMILELGSEQASNYNASNSLVGKKEAASF